MKIKFVLVFIIHSFCLLIVKGQDINYGKVTTSFNKACYCTTYSNKLAGNNELNYSYKYSDWYPLWNLDSCIIYNKIDTLVVTMPDSSVINKNKLFFNRLDSIKKVTKDVYLQEGKSEFYTGLVWGILPALKDIVRINDTLSLVFASSRDRMNMVQNVYLVSHYKKIRVLKTFVFRTHLENEKSYPKYLYMQIDLENRLIIVPSRANLISYDNLFIRDLNYNFILIEPKNNFQSKSKKLVDFKYSLGGTSTISEISNEKYFIINY